MGDADAPDSEPTRVVITGMGAITAFGAGVPALTAGLDAGEVALRELSVFETEGHRTRIGGQIPDAALATADALGAGRHERSTRTDRMALIAAAEALAQSGLDTRDVEGGVGLFFGSSSGGILEGEQWYAKLRAGAPHIQRELASHLTDCSGAAIARRFELRGPVVTTATACVAGSMSVHAAAESLRTGECNAVLAAGVDGLCRLTYAGFNALRSIDEAPARPFQPERVGLSLGEGAGVLVLETLEHARSRGAVVLAELLASAETCDATHMTAPHPEGRGAREALSSVLALAGIKLSDVAFLSAHGTGTPLNDSAESAALRAVFGDALHSLPVTSCKGAIGHLLGACGPIEVILTVESLRSGRVHPTAGPGPVDPGCGVDLVLGSPRTIRSGTVGLSLNLAFGGANTAIAIRALDRAEGAAS